MEKLPDKDIKEILTDVKKSDFFGRFSLYRPKEQVLEDLAQLSFIKEAKASADLAIDAN